MAPLCRDLMLESHRTVCKNLRISSRLGVLPTLLKDYVLSFISDILRCWLCCLWCAGAAKVGSLWALVLGLAVIGAFLLGMLAMHTILRKRPETDYAIPSPLRHRELPIVPNNKSRSSMVHLPTAIAHAVVNSTQQTSSTMTLDKNIDAEEHKSNLYVFWGFYVEWSKGVLLILSQNMTQHCC